MQYKLRCVVCGSEKQKEPAYLCESCGGILEVKYNLKKGDYNLSDSSGIYRYQKFLSINPQYKVELGEGNTPMIKSDRKKDYSLHFKLESTNPTASFKDRGIAVIASKVKEWQKSSMIIASSGNASASASAYAAKSGISLIALVPESTPEGKVAQAVLHGAVLVKVPGGYSNSYALCREMAENYGMIDATTTFINPYARDGYKTIGYEIYENLQDIPDWIIIPVGAGPILAAIHNAFTELFDMGVIEKLPKLVAVQAENCGPIAKAFIAGKDTVEAECGAKQTMASGINDPLIGYTQDGDYTLKCINESGGTAISLSEEEILNSTKLMAEEGIYAEPAGAVGFVGSIKMEEKGLIKSGEKVVVVVTGHGLKNPVSVKSQEIPVLNSAEELSQYLKVQGVEV